LGKLNLGELGGICTTDVEKDYLSVSFNETFFGQYICIIMYTVILGKRRITFSDTERFLEKFPHFNL
jgi:hypothetical protein